MVKIPPKIPPIDKITKSEKKIISMDEYILCHKKDPIINKIQNLEIYFWGMFLWKLLGMSQKSETEDYMLVTINIIIYIT